ncbi:MAG: hypothetical protein KA715_04720 [Xanthomonadaceae bacterium]|nr:hypothetical protein [Xanthomonadaceae bacterium]
MRFLAFFFQNFALVLASNTQIASDKRKKSKYTNEAEAKQRANELVAQDKEYCDLPIIKKLAGSDACP